MHEAKFPLEQIAAIAEISMEKVKEIIGWFSNFIPAATVRTIEAQSSPFVAWEQVLDASV